MIEPVSETANQAIRQIELGFAVIPIATNGKRPVMDNWPRSATTDPAMAIKFLSNPGTANYGMVMPKDCPRIVVVLDLDDGDGATEPWRDRIRALVDTLGPLPETKAHITPSGGRHIFLEWPSDKPPKGDMFLGFTLRVLNNRHQVVGPGSMIKKKGYQDIGKTEDVAMMPKTWVDAFNATQKTSKSTIRQQVEPKGALITVTAAVEGYELPSVVEAGGRYSAIRDYVASRWNRGLSDDELWAGVRDVLAPHFAVGLTEDELRERFDRTLAGIDKRLGEKSSSQTAPTVSIVTSRQGESDSEDDPTILAETDIRLQQLPSSAFPDALTDAAYADRAGDIVRELEAQTVASSEGLLAAVLAYAGSILGVHTYYHGRRPSNPYVVLVGESATGKKTTTMRAVLDSLQDDRVWGDQSRSQIEGLGSGEGIIGTVSRRSQGGFWTGAVISSEAGGQLKVAAREGSILSTVLRQAYDGDMLSNITKGADIVVPAYAYQFGALGGITPDELRELLQDSAEVSNGFANRFLWVPVRQRDVYVSGTARYRLSDVLAVLLKSALAYAQANRSNPMTIDPAAEVLLTRYYDFLVGLKGAAGLTRRLSDAALRFALTRAALEERDDVTAIDVKRSIYLTEYARHGLGWVFGSVALTKDAERVLRALHTLGGEVKMSALLMPAFQSKSKGDRLHDALDVLEGSGLVESYIAKTPGRSATMVRLVVDPYSLIPPNLARARGMNGHVKSDDGNMGISADSSRDKDRGKEGLGSSLWEKAQGIFADELEKS